MTPLTADELREALRLTAAELEARGVPPTDPDAARIWWRSFGALRHLVRAAADDRGRWALEQLRELARDREVGA